MGTPSKKKGAKHAETKLPVRPETPNSSSADDSDSYFDRFEEPNDVLTPLTSATTTPGSERFKSGARSAHSPRHGVDTTPTKPWKSTTKKEGKAASRGYLSDSSKHSDAASESQASDSDSPPSNKSASKSRRRDDSGKHRASKGATAAKREPSKKKPASSRADSGLKDEKSDCEPDARRPMVRVNSFQRHLTSSVLTGISLGVLSDIIRRTEIYEKALSRIISLDEDEHGNNANFLRCAVLIPRETKPSHCKAPVTQPDQHDHIEELHKIIQRSGEIDADDAFGRLIASTDVQLLCFMHQKQVKVALRRVLSEEPALSTDVRFILVWLYIVAIQRSARSNQARYLDCLNRLLSKLLRPIGVSSHVLVNGVEESVDESDEQEWQGTSDDDDDDDDDNDNVFLPVREMRKYIIGCALYATNQQPPDQNFIKYTTKSQLSCHTAAISQCLRKPLGKRDKDNGYIYCFRLFGTTNHIKIGVSQDAYKRLSRQREHYKHCTLEPLWMTTCIKNAWRVERLVFEELREYRRKESNCKNAKCELKAAKHLEWFCIDEEDAKQCVRKWAKWVSGGRYEGSQLVPMAGAELDRLLTVTKCWSAAEACTQCF